MVEASSAPRVLITRPRLEAESLAAQLRDLGYQSFLEPVLEISPFEFEAPALSQYQGIITTSGYALHFLARALERAGLRPGDVSHPVYVVGERSAGRARDLGFANVIMAGADAGALCDYLLATLQDVSKPLLYVRGRDVAYPLRENLQAKGYVVDEIISYAAEARDEFSKATLTLLEERAIDVVLFFSKRTAETFVALAERADLKPCLSSIKALCISESVLRYVQAYTWQETYAAKTPDQDSLIRLLQQTVPIAPRLDTKNVERYGMSSSSNSAPIENAGEVIERFGGIRPMAKKIDVAVTTIQGWKKRDVIPAGRRESILEAAQTYSIDLSDILPGAPPANQNSAASFEKPSAPKPVDVKDTPKASVPPASEKPKAQASAMNKDEPIEDLEERLAAVEKDVVGKSTWLMIALVLILIAVAVAVLWPRQKNDIDRLSALENWTQELAGEVDDVKEKQSFFGTLIPQNLDEQLASLKQQAENTQAQIGDAVNKAKAVSDDVMGENAGSLEERVVKLEAHLQDITGSPVLAGLLEKVQGLSGDSVGQTQLNEAMSQLSALVQNFEASPAVEGVQADVEGVAGEEVATTESSFETMLDAARGNNPALGQTFAGVPAADLKAAAMLLAMTQFRESLNRNNDSFVQDFTILEGLVSEDNVALREALERLAPHAQSGVLTPAGLSNEFKTLAGDAVIASLQGEDVSVGDKAKARMNELFQVEKNGELITGTPTQATMLKAEKELNGGDLAAAIATVQTLDGPAAAQMSDWLEDAQATLAAQDAKALLTQAINIKAYGASKLIQNEETGINILQRNTLPQ